LVLLTGWGNYESGESGKTESGKSSLAARHFQKDYDRDRVPARTAKCASRQALDGEKVILKDHVLEVRNVDGRLHVARKERWPDEWDTPIPVYDPLWPRRFARLRRHRVSADGHDCKR
jgi:hypothetical protein